MDNDYTRHIEKMKQMLLAREVAFEILGVKTSASNEELKRAYRQACLKYHPDRNQQDPNAHKKFLIIKCAYDLLNGGKPCEKLMEQAGKRDERPQNDKYNLENPWGHFLWWREKFFSTPTENGSEPEAYHI
jgi:DnaJ-class molecular chaperone